MKNQQDFIRDAMRRLNLTRVFTEPSARLKKDRVSILDLYTIQREFSRLGKLMDGAHVAGGRSHVRACSALAYSPAIAIPGIKTDAYRAASPEMPEHLIELADRHGPCCRADPSIGGGIARSGLAIFRQTDNGIPVRMALFAVLLGVENQVALSCAT